MLHPIQGLGHVQGLLLTSVAIKAEGRLLVPNQATTIAAVNTDILDAALTVAQAVARPLSRREYAPYFPEGRPTSLHLPSLLWCTPDLASALHAVPHNARNNGRLSRSR